MSVPITPGTGASSVAAELVGGFNYQQIEVYGGGGASVLTVNPDGSFKASIIGTPAFTLSGSPSISGSVNISNTVSVAGATQLAGASPSSIMTITRLDNQVTGSMMGMVGQVVIHGLTSAGGGSYVDVKVDPSGALVTASSSVVTFQGGTQITSISGTVNASVSGTVISQYAPSASLVSGVTSVITGTSSVTVLTGAPGGQRNYITQILATNAAATGTFVNISDGGNVVYSGFAAASGGGFSASFPAPLRQASAQGALCVSTPTQASVVVAVSGFTAA